MDFFPQLVYDTPSPMASLLGSGEVYVLLFRSWHFQHVNISFFVMYDNVVWKLDTPAVVEKKVATTADLDYT